MSDEPPPAAEPAIRVVAMPADTNPYGDIFGGWLLSQMDAAGGTVASRHSRGRAVTIALDGMTFLKPVKVGDVVSVYAEVVSVGRTSMKVDVSAWSRTRDSEAQHKVTHASFTFVAVGEDGAGAGDRGMNSPLPPKPAAWAPPSLTRGEGKNARSPSPLVGEGGARRGAVGGRGVARDRARTLRKGQTDCELRLWRLLRAKRLQGWKFRRQLPIGPYIVDFACPAASVIVEADGGQHAESSYDERRDAWLLGQGWRVIRFWNNDILTNEEGVLTAVLAALTGALPNLVGPSVRPPDEHQNGPAPELGEGLLGGDCG